MKSILLDIQQAQVFFKGKQAFQNLNFQWEEGQTWAIISESGWLQTAFLETIRGNTLIRKGKFQTHFAQAYVEEKSSQKEVHSFRDLIAYVSQKYEFRNKFNQQNFYFQQRFNSSESEETATVEQYLKEVEPKIQGAWTLQKVLDLLDLEKLRDESLLKLSNGETRRLALASGLMRQPSIFLMDHPTTGLDIQSRANFGKVLQSILDAGTQVLLTCNAQDVPEGVTHIAQLDYSGVSRIWKKDEFHQVEQHNLKKNWDWGLLQELVKDDKNESSESIIELKNVSISYQGKKILDQVNWSIEVGDKWQLKGANGSGKSTLISLIIGENPQSYSQDIWLFGRKRGTGESIWDVKRPTGFVAPELARFFPANQTCRKVILSGLFDTMGLFKKVSPEQESLAGKWMKLFELEEFADIPIQRLPLEQQRWTLLARALIKKPRLLILDEASQGLDESQRNLYKETVQKVCEFSGVTLIFVSHYPKDVPVAVDRVFQL
ncbi:ATP-binding cassette domain-containing protein [Algoriphagus kandeliae]|uniref:ATP-binding cassette domain-containing protein n=1 Tax=Algoriphagus kandeliae TaxID=2562278 RepID=A0A4Y9QNH4_9BACT|nr:ATP-binding cassette domain-containing protein [Algoriphagus kandeliae]TFV94201.1 ATP-binding cassette domain-containing protein [Algoriphagus kandeliae]